MSRTQDELNEIRNKVRERTKVYIPDWEAQLPEGSLWSPGSLAQPNCKICNGLGWVKYSRPIGHPEFGKLFFCPCVPQKHHVELSIERSR